MVIFQNSKVWIGSRSIFLCFRDSQMVRLAHWRRGLVKNLLVAATSTYLAPCTMKFFWLRVLCTVYTKYPKVMTKHSVNGHLVILILFSTCKFSIHGMHILLLYTLSLKLELVCHLVVMKFLPKLRTWLPVHQTSSSTQSTHWRCLSTVKPVLVTTCIERPVVRFIAWVIAYYFTKKLT